MNEAKRLSEAQSEALSELSGLDGDGWIKTRWLSGTRAARSSSNLKSLAALGLVESKRWGENKQSQYTWRITPAGRAALNPPTQSHLAGKGEL